MREGKQGAIIGVVTVSDRASAGLYQDESGPAIIAFLERVMTTPAAIANAVRDAVAPFGIEITELPVTPDMLFAKMQAAKSASSAS